MDGKQQQRRNQDAPPPPPPPPKQQEEEERQKPMKGDSTISSSSGTVISIDDLCQEIHELDRSVEEILGKLFLMNNGGKSDDDDDDGATTISNDQNQPTKKLLMQDLFQTRDSLQNKLYELRNHKDYDDNVMIEFERQRCMNKDIKKKDPEQVSANKPVVVVPPSSSSSSISKMDGKQPNDDAEEEQQRQQVIEFFPLGSKVHMEILVKANRKQIEDDNKRCPPPTKGVPSKMALHVRKLQEKLIPLLDEIIDADANTNEDDIKKNEKVQGLFKKVFQIQMEGKRIDENDEYRNDLSMHEHNITSTMAAQANKFNSYQAEEKKKWELKKKKEKDDNELVPEFVHPVVRDGFLDGPLEEEGDLKKRTIVRLEKEVVDLECQRQELVVKQYKINNNSKGSSEVDPTELKKKLDMVVKNRDYKLNYLKKELLDMDGGEDHFKEFAGTFKEAQAKWEIEWRYRQRADKIKHQELLKSEIQDKLRDWKQKGKSTLAEDLKSEIKELDIIAQELQDEQARESSSCAKAWQVQRQKEAVENLADFKLLQLQILSEELADLGKVPPDSFEAFQTVRMAGKEQVAPKDLEQQIRDWHNRFENAQDDVNQYCIDKITETGSNATVLAISFYQHPKYKALDDRVKLAKETKDELLKALRRTNEGHHDRLDADLSVQHDNRESQRNKKSKAARKKNRERPRRV